MITNRSPQCCRTYTSRCLPWQGRPCRIGRSRRSHRGAHVIARSLLKSPEQDARIDWAAVVELPLGL